MSFSSVNLLWQTRFRGLLPVTANSAADSGQVLLIRPDELENRTYQLLLVDPLGEAREAGAVSVETVRKFDGAPGAKLLLAMTTDDLYLVREGRKVRFMGDHRVLFADVSLAADPGW